MNFKKTSILCVLCTSLAAIPVYGAQSQNNEDTAVSYPLTIEHAFGETVIESKPERVATVGWENQDTPLALGVAPVGVSAANYGLVTENNLHPWTDEAF